MRYKEGDKVCYMSTTIKLGEEIQVTKDIEKGWDQHQKDHNAKFEDFLNVNPNLKILSNKMFYMWDGNHSLKAWYHYIDRVH